MHQVQFAGEKFAWSHIESISEIDESEWDACTDGHPLVRHAFFRALEVSGSIGPDMGVVPGYFVLRDATGTISACVPTVLKWGNLREFGPEIHWLERGLAQGCFEWPKFQACSPYYPQIAPKPAHETITAYARPPRRRPTMWAAARNSFLESPECSASAPMRMKSGMTDSV